MIPQAWLYSIWGRVSCRGQILHPWLCQSSCDFNLIFYPAACCGSHICKMLTAISLTCLQQPVALMHASLTFRHVQGICNLYPSNIIIYLPFFDYLIWEHFVLFVSALLKMLNIGGKKLQLSQRHCSVLLYRRSAKTAVCSQSFNSRCRSVRTPCALTVHLSFFFPGIQNISTFHISTFHLFPSCSLEGALIVAQT